MMMPVQTGFTVQTQVPKTLPRRFAPGWGLRARCLTPDCGADAAIDPAPWIAQGLAGTSLARLESRLRCVCGERRASLEIEPSPPASDIQPAIYMFR